MDNTVKALVGIIVLILVCTVGLLFVVGFMSDVIIRKIEENQRRQEKNSVVITTINGHVMELIDKIRICNTELITIQQRLNSILNGKESEKKINKSRGRKNEL